LSTPLIIQLNGYFAIVMETVAGRREVQTNPSKAKLYQKKRYYTLLNAGIKTLVRVEIG
tara:strand:+ start:541 stop:717 length:177 start_codon:yes stop_codon:yes gene_type:complete